MGQGLIKYSENPAQLHLDRCYASWTTKYRILLILIAALVVAPGFLEVVLLKTHGAVDFIILILTGLAPFLVMLFASAGAAGAASCLKYEPEILLTLPNMEAYRLVRSFTRRIAYQWLYCLSGSAIVVSILCTWLIVSIPGYNQSGPPLRILLNQAEILWPILIFSWSNAEVVQFIVLRYNHFKLFAKVALSGVFAMLITVIAALLWVVNYVLLLLPIACIIYIALETRKPTPKMLESL